MSSVSFFTLSSTNDGGNKPGYPYKHQYDCANFVISDKTFIQISAIYLRDRVMVIKNPIKNSKMMSLG
jgi:hypothetical protein